MKRIYDFNYERFEEKEAKKEISRSKAFLPYIIISVFLVMTRAVPEIKKFVESSLVISWDRILGTDISQSLRILNNPGIYFILVVMISQFFLKMEKSRIKVAWLKTLKRIFPASMALYFALALSQTMIYTSQNPFKMESMIIMIAKSISVITGKLYSIFAPFVGILGAYVAGSNTVSNIMFSGFQFATAQLLGLSKTIILSLQVVGGAVGNMICIHNVVAVCATIGIIGKEGTIIKKNLLPCFLYGWIAGLIGVFLIFISPHLF